MLAVHELEEIIIRDITPFDHISAEQKSNAGRKAVIQILEPLAKKDEIATIVCEFEESKTPEAKFAKWIDKLDSCLQCKLYDMGGCIDPKNPQIANERAGLQENNGNKPSDLWIERQIKVNDFDETFTKIAREARKDQNWKSRNLTNPFSKK
jgi:5'-deoxynucleotidase YfbR-like HD superfamily hydrolase